MKWEQVDDNAIVATGKHCDYLVVGVKGGSGLFVMEHRKYSTQIPIGVYSLETAKDLARFLDEKSRY